MLLREGVCFQEEQDFEQGLAYESLLPAVVREALLVV